MKLPHDITIAFDGKRAAQNRTGLGNYSRFVVRALSRYANAKKLLLYVPSPKRVEALEGLDAEPNVTVVYPETRPAKMLRSIWRIWGVSNRVLRDGANIYHGLSNELPVNIRKAKGLKTVVTIHDIIFRRYPECYHLIDRLIYDYKFRRACQTADRVIAVSECTKRDIVKDYGISPDKIDVVYQGCDPRFKLRVSDEQKKNLRNVYNLDVSNHFVLYLGSIERRKNLMLLAKALRHMPKGVKVVAVGKHTPYADEVQKYIDSEGLADRLTMLHGVHYSLLPALYQMAAVFVYPSRYEGFGIPILEALTSGTPVVACTGSCLEEAGGPSSIYVSPDDDRALADAIMRVMSDEELRGKMIADGLEYAKRFEPEKLTDDLLAVYLKALDA